METRVATPLVWVRALFAGSFAGFLGLAGHVLASEPVPGRAALMVLLAITIAGSVPFLTRPASAPRMLVLLGGGQTFTHLGLILTAEHRAGRSVDWNDLYELDGGLPALHLTDLAVHLVAAALVAVWLAHGERLVFTALQLTARFLLTLICPVGPVMFRRVQRATMATVIAAASRNQLLRRTVSRRGPPVLAV